MTLGITGPLRTDFSHRVRTGNTKILAREMQTHVLTKPVCTCPSHENGPGVSQVLVSNKTWSVHTTEHHSAVKGCE